MAIDKINFSYPKGSLQSVFDNETLTALELAAKTSKKVDECVEIVNGVEQTAIEATAIVDDMYVIQNQFVTDNSDTRAQLITDNQEFIDGLEASKEQFETDLDNEVDTIVDNVGVVIETNVNTKIEELITDGTINNLINVNTEKAIAEATGTGVISGLNVLPQASPDMSVLITPGVAHLYNGKRYELIENATHIIDPADALYPRIDIIYINSFGVLTYGKGEAKTDPTAPTPINSLILSEINIIPTTTSINASLIVDKRQIKLNIPTIENTLIDITKKTTGIINILQMGAIGDYDDVTKTGTDNTLFINNAIEHALENNLIIYIPPGHYKINSSIQLLRNTNIIADNATFWYSGNDIAIKAHGTLDTYIYPRIKSLTVRKINNDFIGVGMSVQLSKMGGIFKDCRFFGFEYGVKHSGTTPINTPTPEINDWAWLNHFINCRFSDNKYGVLCSVNSNGVTFDKCLFNDNEQYGIKIFDSFNIRIQNCEFETNGILTNGSAIIINDGRSILISGCYFEANGIKDDYSPVIKIGSEKGQYSYHPQIVNNYFNHKSALSAIQINEAQGYNITGNYFVSDLSLYDIDLRNTVSHINGYIAGNTPSRSDGAIPITASVSPSAFLKHGNYQNKYPSLELSGTQANIKLNDSGTDKEIMLKSWNDRLRIHNNSGEVVALFDGQTKQSEIAIKSGATASRPVTPTNGCMYFDTTITKPIWYNSGVWKDATGTTV